VLSLLYGSAAAAQTWGAIAFSPQSRHRSFWADAATEEEAKRGALQECGSGCEVEMTTQARYFAFAMSDKLGIGWADGDEPEDVVHRAVEACIHEGQGVDCHWSGWARNDGDTAHPYGNIYKPGPGRPRLADVGGPFADALDLSAFKVANDELCWAAIVQAIFFNATGNKLSQYKIAQLDATVSRSIDRPSDLASFPKAHMRPINCTADNKSEPLCNQPQNTQLALDYIGIGMPFAKYPDPGDSTAIFLAIRRSLEHGLPVGMTTRHFDSTGHVLVIYGADYHADPKNPEMLEATLEVFDPADGSTHSLSSNTYDPAYKLAPQTFTRWLTLANYEDPSIKTKLSKEACGLMTSGVQH
jgi:hypothetical protein